MSSAVECASPLFTQWWSIRCNLVIIIINCNRRHEDVVGERRHHTLIITVCCFYTISYCGLYESLRKSQRDRIVQMKRRTPPFAPVKLTRRKKNTENDFENKFKNSGENQQQRETEKRVNAWMETKKIERTNEEKVRRLDDECVGGRTKMLAIRCHVKLNEWKNRSTISS